MKKEIEDIREALKAIGSYDEETGEALESLESAIDEIDKHPALGRVQSVVSETAEQVKNAGGETEESVSGRWNDLKEHLDEWEDHHPVLVLSVGKVAEALAVVGL